MWNRGAGWEGAARAHGTGASKSELARGLRQMTNFKDGEVGLVSCVMWGRGVVARAVDSGSFSQYDARAAANAWTLK